MFYGMTCFVIDLCCCTLNDWQISSGSWLENPVLGELLVIVLEQTLKLLSEPVVDELPVDGQRPRRHGDHQPDLAGVQNEMIDAIQFSTLVLVTSRRKVGFVLEYVGPECGQEYAAIPFHRPDGDGIAEMQVDGQRDPVIREVLDKLFQSRFTMMLHAVNPTDIFRAERDGRPIGRKVYGVHIDGQIDR